MREGVPRKLVNSIDIDVGEMWNSIYNTYNNEIENIIKFWLISDSYPILKSINITC